MWQRVIPQAKSVMDPKAGLARSASRVGTMLFNNMTTDKCGRLE
jgi:hypothetical protein